MFRRPKFETVDIKKQETKPVKFKCFKVKKFHSPEVWYNFLVLTGYRYLVRPLAQPQRFGEKT
jgi:hypothetical protein